MTRVDVGTGDGAYAYQLAKNQPGTLVIGTDSNTDNLREISHRASRKPSRGGLSNVVFGQLSLEQAPGELEGLAGSLSVLLPWASLLGAVVLPEIDALKKLRGLCRADADLLVVFGYGQISEPNWIRDLTLLTQQKNGFMAL